MAVLWLGVVERDLRLASLKGKRQRAAGFGEPSDGGVVASLVASAFATNVITADQFIAIVLPGRMFKQAFATRGLAPVVLSRSVGNAAIATSPLIPWNSCGAYMAATLGVATLSYAPFAIFCLALPVITVAISYAGLRMPRVAAASIGTPAT